MDDKERRKRANDDLIKRFKRGETLASVPPQATWFPPRPIIKKNKDALDILFTKRPKLRSVECGDTED